MAYALVVLHYGFWSEFTDAQSVQVNTLPPYDILQLFTKVFSIKSWAIVPPQMPQCWFGIKYSGTEPSCVNDFCLKKMTISSVFLEGVSSLEASIEIRPRKTHTKRPQETQGLLYEGIWIMVSKLVLLV